MVSAGKYIPDSDPFPKPFRTPFPACFRLPNTPPPESPPSQVVLRFSSTLRLRTFPAPFASGPGLRLLPLPRRPHGLPPAAPASRCSASFRTAPASRCSASFRTAPASRCSRFRAVPTADSRPTCIPAGQTAFIRDNLPPLSGRPNALGSDLQLLPLPAAPTAFSCGPGLPLLPLPNPLHSRQPPERCFSRLKGYF